MNKYLKYIIIALIFTVASCGIKKNTPNKEFVSYYYKGREVIQKIDSITDSYNLENLPNYKEWAKSYYIGVYAGDSVEINNFYITVDKENRLYIFSINEIPRKKLKEFKFLIN